ncbi:MAG: pyridoxal-dependent decarboxylase [Bacteroidota bacterium]
MDAPFFSDDDQLADLLNQARDFILDFRDDSERPAGSTRTEFPAPYLADVGAGAQDALSVFKEQWSPYLVASPSDRYLGYVTGGTTPAALVGDILTAGLDQNPQDVAGFGDVSAAIEHATIGLLLDLFGLPREFFHGGFVTGATMSNFTGLAVARQWAGKRQGYDVAADGLQGPITVLTAVPHSSATKALSLLGLGKKNITFVATLPDREAMDVADLRQKLDALPPGQPAIVIASGGTVNTVDFDDLAAIDELRDEYDFWLHVDAAFGGFAALHPEYAHLLGYWEEADSICVDNHKWLNVPYDSGCWFVRQEHLPLQITTFQNTNAAYLGEPEDHFSYLNAGPENSRRLRALPAWFTLTAYGREGYEDIVRRCIDTAQSLGLALDMHSDWELLAPVHLNVVAFRPKGANADTVDRLSRVLNARGKYFLTPTTLHGQRGLRAAFVNWQAEVRQVPELVAELNTALNEAFQAERTPPGTSGRAHKLR